MSSNYERELMGMIGSLQGWIAHRAAGSQGEADLISIQQAPAADLQQQAVVIEVKKTSEPDKINTHCRGDKQQWQHYVDLHERGYTVVYAVRHTSGSTEDRWQIHPIREALETEFPHILRRPDGISFSEYFQEV